MNEYDQLDESTNPENSDDIKIINTNTEQQKNQAKHTSMNIKDDQRRHDDNRKTATTYESNQTVFNNGKMKTLSTDGKEMGKMKINSPKIVKDSVAKKDDYDAANNLIHMSSNCTVKVGEKVKNNNEGTITEQYVNNAYKKRKCDHPKNEHESRKNPTMTTLFTNVACKTNQLYTDMVVEPTGKRRRLLGKNDKATTKSVKKKNDKKYMQDIYQHVNNPNAKLNIWIRNNKNLLFRNRFFKDEELTGVKRYQFDKQLINLFTSLSNNVIQK